MTIGEALARAARRLAAAEVEQPLRDARLLLAHASGWAREVLLAWPERALPAEAQSQFEGYVRRRAAREPVSRILGRRGFWTLDLELSSETLDPRPDTETLVEAALDHRPTRRQPRVLDLGTGTGAILLALLAEWHDAWGVGVDCSHPALCTARRNAMSVGIGARAAFVAADWGTALAGQFDVVVSNPPYIPADEIAGLAAEVGSYDPRRSLDGGSDGLDAYRCLAREVPRLLAPAGIAVLEIGAAQSDAVSALFAPDQLSLLEVRADLSGTPRALMFSLTGQGA